MTFCGPVHYVRGLDNTQATVKRDGTNTYIKWWQPTRLQEAIFSITTCYGQ
jgi:hypothetical protein